MALTTSLSWEDTRTLDTEAPTHWELAGAGTGRRGGGDRLRLRYGTTEAEDSVLLSVPLQRLLGVDVHPTVGLRHHRVVVELLSPAGRPLQRTEDLPGFWRGSYAQVRAEMRGRYPKHAWPERPWEPRT